MNAPPAGTTNLRGTTVAYPAAEVAAGAVSEGEHESKPWQRLFVIAACLSAAVLIFGPVIFPPSIAHDHFFYLARNLVQGRLSVDEMPRVYPDWVPWNGHRYLPFGPLPGVMIIPFLPVLELGLPMRWISHLFTLVNVFVFYRVLGLSGITDERRKWALLLFFGSSAYFTVGITGMSQGFGHVIAILFLLLAIGEALGKRRVVLIGLFVGLAAATRFTALFALPFFVWLLWRNEKIDESRPEETREPVGSRKSLTRLASTSALLLAGLAGPVLMLFLYNYLRFGKPLETGYTMSLLGYEVLTQARSMGMFSIIHIPKNLFMMLLQGPIPWPRVDAPVLEFPYLAPTPWGMGMFFTSPALVYAFRAHLKDRFVQACWIAILCVMLPVITYYGVGWVQFGYRYSLDFLPFMLLLAARGFPSPMPRTAKWLVIVGVAVNIWGAIFMLLWSA